VLASNCDVVLMDSFDNEACSSILEGVTDEDSGVKLILFGMDNDGDRFLRAVHLGICGYLLKEASAAEIVAAVRAAARGEATCPPSLCMTLMQYICRKKYEKFESESMGCTHKNLTPRQLQLLRLVAEGLTNKEIAANLNLSQFTVKNHLRRVMRQVEATSRYDAVDLLRASGRLAI